MRNGLGRWKSLHPGRSTSSFAVVNAGRRSIVVFPKTFQRREADPWVVIRQIERIENVAWL